MLQLDVKYCPINQFYRKSTHLICKTKSINIQNDVFCPYTGVFAAVISIRYGYGMVGIIGCITAASGLLLASLCTTSLRGLIALLVSCVSGKSLKHLIQ